MGLMKQGNRLAGEFFEGLMASGQLPAGSTYIIREDGGMTVELPEGFSGTILQDVFQDGRELRIDSA